MGLKANSIYCTRALYGTHLRPDEWIDLIADVIALSSNAVLKLHVCIITFQVSFLSRCTPPLNILNTLHEVLTVDPFSIIASRRSRV